VADVCTPVECIESARACATLPTDPACCTRDEDCEAGTVCGIDHECIPDPRLSDAFTAVDAAVFGPDANVPADDAAMSADAGLPGNDAAVAPMVDAGPLPDTGRNAEDAGSSTRDAGGDIDAGAPGAFAGSGCTCRTASPRGASAWSILVAIGIALAAAGRRR
jgi:hypothetical protein